MNQQIGKGHYSTIFLFQRRKNKQLVAVKRVKSRQIAENEAAILSKFKKNDYIIHLRRAYNMATCDFLVLEYCEHGSLLQFLQSNENRRDCEQFLEISYDMLQAIKFIHEKNVIHRDIKPENFCLTSSLTVKLTDFGISIETNDDGLASGDCGTQYFKAPEICKKDQMYTNSVDIYSFGMTLYFMLLFRGDFASVFLKMSYTQRQMTNTTKQKFLCLLTKLNLLVLDERLTDLLFYSIQNTHLNRLSAVQLLNVAMAQDKNWACRACTFQNCIADWPKCLMCGTINGVVVEQIEQNMKNLQVNDVECEEKAAEIVEGSMNLCVEDVSTESLSEPDLITSQGIVVENEEMNEEEKKQYVEQNKGFVKPIFIQNKWICGFCQCVDAEWTMDHMQKCPLVPAEFKRID